MRSSVASAIQRLQACGIPRDEARLSALYLLAAAVHGAPRATLPAARALLSRGGQTRLPPDTEAIFSASIARRAAREPVQYILGEWSFATLAQVRTRRPTLVPRPETEELVALGTRIAALLAPNGGGGRLLDVGCGSGVVGIALLAALPSWRGDAVDVSPAAAALTVENAALAGVAARLRVHTHDVFAWEPPPPWELPPPPWVAPPTCELQPSSAPPLWHAPPSPALPLSLSPAPLPSPALPPPGRYNLVVANVPYIPDNELGDLEPEVRCWEDPAALAGGAPAGAGFLLRLLLCGGPASWLCAGGALLAEIHPPHARLLRALLLPAAAAALPWELPPASGLGGVLAAAGCAAGAPPWHPFDSVEDALAAGQLVGGAGVESPEGAVAAVATTLQKKWVWRGAYCDFQRLPRFIEVQCRGNLNAGCNGNNSRGGAAAFADHDGVTR